MKNLPIGIQTFSQLIQENYLYVDKTREIYNLIERGGKYFFISRPRRFGKSLMLSTLKEMFSGNETLFNGLWIHDKIQWDSFPVIHMDLLKVNSKTPGKLEKSLEKLIRKMAGGFNIETDPESDYKDVFADFIEKLAKNNKKKVVILIDEYDKPIIDHLDWGDKTTARENRKILKNFYSVIKGSDEHLKFVLLTGVSKFSRVSIFSDLNNLDDITLDERYATLMGYTGEELVRYFPTGDSDAGTLAKIKKWYNGYSWDGRHFVYNPLSILLYFEKKRFTNYWFSTGTPTFLIDTIKEKEFPVGELEKIEVDDYAFESFDIDNMEVTSLLFQTGYLTIKKKEIIDDETIYYLSYPNKEVRESFLKHLLKGFSEKDFRVSRKYLKQLRTALEQNKLDDFFASIKSFFSSIPYNMFVSGREAYYHTIIYLLLRLAGVSIYPEIETNTGRLDAVVEEEKTIYIMELKIGTSGEALNQIKEKRYYQPYLTSGKSIMLVGIGIDPSIRNISDYRSESFSLSPGEGRG
jgi:hypothetical protein